MPISKKKIKISYKNKKHHLIILFKIIENYSSSLTKYTSRIVRNINKKYDGDNKWNIWIKRKEKEEDLGNKLKNIEYFT
jgi:hypothetical protein